jgi:hypothetical protein
MQPRRKLERSRNVEMRGGLGWKLWRLIVPRRSIENLPISAWLLRLRLWRMPTRRKKRNRRYRGARLVFELLVLGLVSVMAI